MEPRLIKIEALLPGVDTGSIDLERVAAELRVEGYAAEVQENSILTDASDEIVMQLVQKILGETQTMVEEY
ncbi:MAG: hypothetical protein PHP92_05520 [Candidatus Nanoarchaeia archaeon]|nr:hypothetical protein [Candidatus Nanoarchaeia archaeon]